jgi:hypothetical protein
MVYPMMVAVDFSSLRRVHERPKGLIITLVVNWLITPFTMAALGVLFFEYLFADLIDPADAGQYIAGLILLGLDGSATATAITTTTATLGQTEFGEGDGDTGHDVIDEAMEVAEATESDGTRQIGLQSFGYDYGAPGLGWVDEAMESPISVDEGGVRIGGVEFSLSDYGPGLDHTDEAMEVAASMGASGATDGFGGTATSTHSDTEIGWRSAENLASATMMSIRGETYSARPIWNYSHFIIYGQSLSAGSEGSPPLSLVAKHDNLQLGGRVGSRSGVCSDGDRHIVQYPGDKHR